MTDNPTADKARLLIDALRIAARASRRPEKTTAWQAADALQSALARAEAAEARIAVLCEEIDMKEGVLSALRTRAEAAEKERDELLLKHCTALERESFENLIEHEKWQEREAIYKSQIEAGAKRIEAAEKALGSAQWQPITNADKQVGPSFFGGVWLETANGWEWHEHVAFWSAGMQSFCDTWSGERIDLEWRKPLPTPAPMPARALSAAGGQ
jgi:hypothetical protein